MIADACPGLETWKSFLLGVSPEGESLELEKHLANCALCQELMPSVPANDLLVTAFKTQKHLPRLKNPHLEELQRKLCSFRVATAVPLPDATPGVSAPFQATAAPTKAQMAAPAPNDTPGCLAPPQAPGEMGRLLHYRVLRHGKGGMGVVYQAEDTLLKRPVALKVMRPELARDEHNRQRFLREARAMAQLTHDNIVTVHQVGEERGMPFLAMPLLQGQTLEDRLRYESRLPLHEALRIGREIALGLAVAHAHNVVHRDIKPGNLWLEEGVGRVKILDFGLAWMEAPQGEQTIPGAMMGTPGYMAPEQAEGETDQRADLFSLGCVLYRMVAGEPPYKGATTLHVLRKMLTEKPTPPHELNPAVPLPLSQLIQRLLSPNPADRPTSAPVVARVIETIQGQITASPTPPPPSYPTAILLAAERMMSPQAVPALPAIKTPTRARPLWRRPKVLAAACILALLGGWIGWKTFSPPAPSDDGGAGRSSGGQTPEKPIAWTRQLIPLQREPNMAGPAQGDGAWVLHPAPLEKLNTWSITSDAAPANFYIQEIAIRGDQIAFRARTWKHWDLAKRSEAPAPFDGAYAALTPDGRTQLQSNFTQATGYSIGLVDAKEPNKRRVSLLLGVQNGPNYSFSPDGRNLALVNQDSGILTFWDVQKGSKIKEAPGQAMGSAVAWSPDGKTAAYVVTIDNSSALSLIQPGSGNPAELWKLDVAFESGLPRPYWSPDGKRVAIASTKYLPLVVELETGMALTVNVGEPIQMGPFAWSPDGRRVAVVAEKDNSVLVWDIAEQAIVHRFKGHTSPLSSVLFLPDNHTLVSAGYTDKTVRFWSLDTGQPRGTIVPIGNFLAAFSADGHYAVPSGSESQLKFIIEDKTGNRRDVEAGEMATEYGFKNDREKVRLDGR